MAHSFSAAESVTVPESPLEEATPQRKLLLDSNE